MKVVKKGRAAVDSMFEGGDDYHVLDEAGEIFNVILNSVRVIVNIIAKHETDRYYCWSKRTQQFLCSSTCGTRF